MCRRQHRSYYIYKRKQALKLSNHLGNVLVTISDKKVPVPEVICGFAGCEQYVHHYEPEVITANDYYPYGMNMPGRKYEATPSSTYRYSINGQEKDKELNENITTALYWEYDSRIGRRWNIDPRPNVSVSPFGCFAGNPIWQSDPMGDTLRGLNVVSAGRARESIKNDVNAICSERKNEIMAYFKMGTDNVTFNKFNMGDFKKTLSGLDLSDDQEALLMGYAIAINDNKTHFIGIVKDGEKIDISKAKNIKANLFRNFKGPTHLSPDQSVTMIWYSQNGNGKRFLPAGPDFKVSNGLFFSHEVIGHALSYYDFWKKFQEINDPLFAAKKITKDVYNARINEGIFTTEPKLSNLASIQVYNIYLRAVGLPHQHPGTDHNVSKEHPNGVPMDETKRNEIPSYLK